MAAPPDHDAAREDRRGYSEGCQCLKCEHFRTCGTCQSQGGKACTKCQREMWTKFAACRKCKKCTDYYEHFYPYIECLALQARTLWTMPTFHDCHLKDSQGSQRLIQELVKLDRLPRQNGVEAMRLLKRAWCEYDVAMHLAGQYKVIGKIVFFAELLLGWFLVVIATTQTNLNSKDSPWDLPAGSDVVPNLEHSVIALSLLASLVYSIDSMLEAKQRWRALRHSAGALESIIWKYRTRVGPFAVGQSVTSLYRDKAELALSEALTQWVDEVSASANLDAIDFEKVYPAHIYKHHQYPPQNEDERRDVEEGIVDGILNAKKLKERRGTFSRISRVAGPSRRKSRGGQQEENGDGRPPGYRDSLFLTGNGSGSKTFKKMKEDWNKQNEAKKASKISPKDAAMLDDFQSPVKPMTYIENRLKRQERFYQERLPVYTLWHKIHRLIILLLSMGSSAMAIYRFTPWVVVLTSLAATVTSWGEFSNLSQKITRYNNAILSIKKLLIWWETLSGVERAAVENINRLIEAGEGILNNERVAWQSTAGSKEGAATDKGEGEDERDHAGGKRAKKA